jgi:peptide/nickel transport system ATP-binding protein
VNRLEVRHLCTSFVTDEGRVDAVADVSFAIRAGGTTAIVGESGSGKSVTSLTLMRLLPRATRTQVRRLRGNRIAMIFQEPMTSLNPVFTVGDQIAEALRLHRGAARPGGAGAQAMRCSTGRHRRRRARLDEYPHQLSGGMRQRVMIAMALACDPDAADRRRADHRARRDDPGADPRRCCAAAARARHGDPADHPRPRRGRRDADEVA